MEDILKIDVKELELYKKKKFIVHYLRSCDIADDNQPIIIHTLEGDVTVSANENTYIMIGPGVDLYPVSKKIFDSKYQNVDAEVDTYTREVIIKNGWNPEKVRACANMTDSYVYAKQMQKEFAVYVKNCNSIIYGNPGDYYATSYEELDNSYIINRDIMELTYYKIVK